MSDITARPLLPHGAQDASGGNMGSPLYLGCWACSCWDMDLGLGSLQQGSKLAVAQMRVQ